MKEWRKRFNNTPLVTQAKWKHLTDQTIVTLFLSCIISKI